MGVNQDYTMQSGEEYTNIWIAIVNDDDTELQEYFTVELGLSETDPNVVLGDPSVVEVTIWDDEIFGK